MASLSTHSKSYGVTSFLPENALLNPCRDLLLYSKDLSLIDASLIPIPPNWPFELNFDMSLQYKYGQYSSVDAIDDIQIDSLIDDMYLCNLNPLKWKDQDHYRLLGLSSLRQNATLNDIKKSYHKMVLLYHPDKRQQKQGGKPSTYETDSNLFKCIQKAYEVLTDPQQRHAFDSVDPKFDDTIPESLSQKKLSSDPFLFYKTFIPVFEANARFSKIQPVPRLGSPVTSRKDIESFYTFWYNFESIRTFEYLDEEDQCQADNRYDKRYLEKKNKASRLKRKTEDNIRIRKLVDNAVQSDPRLMIFKEQDKKEKEEQKRLKAAALMLKNKPIKTSNESDRFKSKQVEDAEKIRLLGIKKQKETERSELKKLRKEIRAKIKEHAFFTPNSDINLLENRITLIEAKLEAFCSIDELRTFFRIISEKIVHCVKTGNVDDFYKNFAIDSNHPLRNTDKEAVDLRNNNGNNVLNISNMQTRLELDEKNSSKKKMVEWSTSEVQCLIKACNAIPGGTRMRWEKISSYIKEHTNVQYTRTTEEIIEKSQEILKSGKSALDKLDENELQNSIKKKPDPRIIVSTNDTNGIDNTSCATSKGASGALIEEGNEATIIWTKSEQALLEDGLRNYPVSNPNRWDLISECIQTKTKPQIIERFKEIARSIKAMKNSAG